MYSTSKDPVESSAHDASNENEVVDSPKKACREASAIIFVEQLELLDMMFLGLFGSIM
jgi:hypothetical protein